MPEARKGTPSLIVNGDVTMDWNLARTRRSVGPATEWNADDCTRAYWQRGRRCDGGGSDRGGGS